MARKIYRGLSFLPKTENFKKIGRGAFYAQRSRTVKFGGVHRSENAGMSSESTVRNCAAENPRFPPQCKSAEG